MRDGVLLTERSCSAGCFKVHKQHCAEQDNTSAPVATSPEALKPHEHPKFVLLETPFPKSKQLQALEEDEEGYKVSAEQYQQLCTYTPHHTLCLLTSVQPDRQRWRNFWKTKACDSCSDPFWGTSSRKLGYNNCLKHTQNLQSLPTTCWLRLVFEIKKDAASYKIIVSSHCN